MNLDRYKTCSVGIDLAFVYAISLFFSFFVYGGVADKYWFGIFIFPLIYFSVNKINLRLNIKVTNFAATLLIGLFFWLLNNENATNSLVGDHLYHASVAYAIPLLVIKVKSLYFPEVSASQILWLYSVGVVGFTGLMAFVFGRSKKLFSISLISIGVLILSIAVIGGLANNDPHPPLRSYALSLLGFFGINSAVFRLQGLIPLLILTCWIVEREGVNWRAAIFLVFIYSIPVLFFNTFIVEYSIWTFAILTVFLIETDDNAEWSDRKIILFAIAFALVGLIRQTAAFGLVLLLINCLFQKNYKVLRWVVLIALPNFFQIFKSFINGNPATYVPSEVFLNIPTNIGIFERLLISLGPESLSQMVATTGAPLLVLLFFYVARNVLVKNTRMLTIIVVHIFMFWLLFHAIRPTLWGVPRYQLEYISPLVVTGFYSITRSSAFARRILPLLILFNILCVFDAYRNIKNYKIDYPEYFKGETPYFSESVFNTEQAIRSSYDKCKGGFNLGESYSENFPLVLAGLSVKEVSDSLNYSISSSAIKSNLKLEGSSIRCSLESVSGFSPGSFYNKTRNTSTIVKIE